MPGKKAADPKPPRMQMVTLEVVQHPLTGCPAIRLQIEQESHVIPMHPSVALDVARALIVCASHCLFEDEEPEELLQPDKENVS